VSDITSEDGISGAPSDDPESSECLADFSSSNLRDFSFIISSRASISASIAETDFCGYLQ
jgi:hypothetical protein